MLKALPQQFSPLPWKYGKDQFTPSANYRKIEAGYGVTTPTTRGFTIYGIISEADCRLIVGAPKLFMLLQQAYMETKLPEGELKDSISFAILEILGSESLPVGKVL